MVYGNILYFTMDKYLNHCERRIDVYRSPPIKLSRKKICVLKKIKRWGVIQTYLHVTAYYSIVLPIVRFPIRLNENNCTNLF